MYKHCYDDNHSYIEFDAKVGSYNKRRRKGIYDRLMCKECEKHIQRFEDYAKYILYDEAKEYIRKRKEQFFTNNYDYKKLKLFVLSLIWRASISVNDVFDKVSLGKYEEEVRNILYMELDTPVNKYPCLIYQTHTANELADGVFMAMFPTKSKSDGKTIYQFIADGLFFFVGVGTNSARTFKQGSSLSFGSLRIGYNELSKISSFNDVFNRLDRQGKFSVYEKKYLS